MQHRVLGLAVAAVALAIAAGAAILLVRVPDPPPPSPPPGAVSLVLRTLPLRTRPVIGLPRACPVALVPSVRFATEGNSVLFKAIDDERVLPVVFPAGFTAWRVDGVAVIVAPEGIVVARENDVLSGLAGASANNGDLNVCFTGPDEYPDIVETG